MKAKLIALGVVLVVLLGGTAAYVVLDDDGGNTPGRPIAFEVTPPQVLAGEKVTVAGRVGPAGRDVLLQRQEGEEWVTVSEAKAGEGGAFSFEVVAAPAQQPYRVEAPATEIGGESLKVRRTEGLTLGGVSPGVALQLGPPIGQSKDGEESLTLGEAVVTPAREGADVAIERNRDGRWSLLAEGKQDEGGRFAFVLPSEAVEDPASLRAVTKLTRGGEPIYSTVAATSPYDLVWQDEFDSGSAMAEHWYTAPAITSQRPCTTTTPDMGVVRNGVAELSVARDPSKPRSADCSKGWLHNAQFTTQNDKLFTYGVFAARIKFQKEQGMHGSFFLYNLPESDPGVPRSEPGALGVEIDTVEYFGDDNVSGGLRGAIQNSLYYPKLKDDDSIEMIKRGGRRDTTAILGEDRPSDGFHVYSVEWTPTEYIFRLDGQETFRLAEGVSKRAHYLVLSMLVSDYEYPRLDAGELPGTTEVDWVRVWQRPAA